MAQLTRLEPAKPSNFDAHKPPEKALIDDCVHCGFCLPSCPTYVLWGNEMDSPRGRIYMMKKSSQGEAPLDKRFQLHMDNCLGCMACMTACPSGVQYNKLIEDTRAQVARHIPRSVADADLSTPRPAETNAIDWFAAVAAQAPGTDGGPLASCAHGLLARTACS